jgi:outer membrane immunogenic protein
MLAALSAAHRTRRCHRPFGPTPSGSAAQSIGAYPTSLNVKQTGFIGGGQIGYNWQLNRLVAGFETDFQGTSAKGSSLAEASRVKR